MNLLILTSLYPVPDYKTNTTPVVHYLAKEWKKLGHNVKIIHNENKFLLVFYLLPKFFKDKIESYFGVRIPGFNQRKSIEYIIDSITVHRIPILKIIPFGKFFNWQIKKQSKLIINICEHNNFYPHFIIGHWEYPQIPIIVLIRNKYLLSKSVLVFHQLFYIKKCLKLQKDLNYIDFVGFRSLALKKDFINSLGIRPNLFICYSGIPDSYITEDIVYRKFASPPYKFLFVGLLIFRKFPSIILESLLNSSFKDYFQLNYIGQGPLKSEIETSVIKNKINDRVGFLNKIPRVEVMEFFRNSDIFIMISKDEAFGLVYLEAMLMGCIVIASKNEGMDGIIINGINGFLINAGNKIELTELLEKIKGLSFDELNIISKNAVNTAKELTDSKVAKEYLENLNII